jgi:hypothetical protein
LCRCEANTRPPSEAYSYSACRAVIGFCSARDPPSQDKITMSYWSSEALLDQSSVAGVSAAPPFKVSAKREMGMVFSSPPPLYKWTRPLPPAWLNSVSSMPSRRGRHSI